MALEFSKLGQVQQIESIGDDTTVLVENEGEVRRVSASSLFLGFALNLGLAKLVTDENDAIITDAEENIILI